MKYILSLSFGKDSMAMLIEVIKRKLPLDYVIFCDIKFNDKISGEHPLMAEWIPTAEKILKDEFGIDVIHLTAKKNYKEYFYTEKKKGKKKGEIYGVPYVIGAWCNSRLKLQPIANFTNKIIKKYGAITEYIGIAKDEPKRLERYKQLETKKRKYITLAELNITENQALEICREYNLLSPKYTNSFRGGCWFCPKQNLNDLYNLYINYKEYYNLLEQMEKDSLTKFKVKKTLEEIRQDFEKGIIPKPPKKMLKKNIQIGIFENKYL